GLTEVRGCVPVRRVVAAAHVTAGHAEPQVDPLVADPQAVLAAVRARDDFADLIEVGAGRHREPARIRISGLVVIPRPYAGISSFNPGWIRSGLSPTASLFAA